VLRHSEATSDAGEDEAGDDTLGAD
jgi:hypothetical protein